MKYEQTKAPGLITSLWLYHKEIRATVRKAPGTTSSKDEIYRKSSFSREEI